MTIISLKNKFVNEMESIFQEFLGKDDVFGLDSLEPGDCERVAGLFRDITNRAGSTTMREYMESCDPVVNNLSCAGEPARYKETSVKQIHVGFGEVDVKRRVYQLAGGGLVCPLDCLFGVENEYFLPFFAASILYSVANNCPGEVVEEMAKFGLAAPSATAVRRLVNNTGESLESNREALSASASLARRVPVDKPGALVVSMDGASVPMRMVREGESYHSKVEYKIAMAGVVGIYGEAEEDKSGKLKMPRIASSETGRMPEEKFPTFKDAIELEVSSVMAELPEDVPKVLLMDGARSLWSYADKSQVYNGFLQLVDFFHAKEHLHSAAKLIFGDGMKATREYCDRWTAKLKENAGAAKALAASMEYHMGKRKNRLSKKKKKDIQTEANYFKNNAGRMEYSSFLAKGLPIGSGPVEACCKSLIKTRLCRSGMSWSVKGGQAVLSLRGYRMSGGWKPMWRKFMELKLAKADVLSIAA